MAHQILELLNSQMHQINASVDLTLSSVSADGETFQDGAPDPWLNTICPIVNYSDQELLILKFQSFTPYLAYIVATDGEIPSVRRNVQITQEILGNLKIALSQVFTEKDLERARKADMLAASNNSIAAQAIRDMYLEIPAMLSEGVINLSMLLALRVLTTGKCTYRDPVTKLPTDLVYEVPSTHLPTTLTGNKRWSQAATATGIDDLVKHLTDYYGTRRQFPPYVVMNSVDFINLRNQASTKELVARNKGILIDGAAANATTIANIVPPTKEDIEIAIGQRLTTRSGQIGTITIVISDSIWYQQGENGQQLSGSYIPDNYYFFAWDRMLERAVVPTASNNFAGGLSTTTEPLSLEPPRGRVSVAGRIIPFCADPRMIGARNVENTALAA